MDRKCVLTLTTSAKKESMWKLEDMQEQSKLLYKHILKELEKFWNHTSDYYLTDGWIRDST